MGRKSDIRKERKGANISLSVLCLERDLSDKLKEDV